jgi:predicted transcriptional regulator
VQTCVLLSVKPEYAQAILDGTKTFEFRRTIFRREHVTRVVLYASHPVSKVVGEFTIAGVLTMSPSRLWKATVGRGGVKRAFFDEYFAGKDEGHALEVASVLEYPQPLDLREHFGLARPPQSFCYLRAESSSAQLAFA